MLKNLKTLKVKEQITKDPKDFAKYELGDKEAVHATFYKGKDVAYEFWFGKSGGVGQMTRIKGQEGGYAIDASGASFDVRSASLSSSSKR